MMMMLMRADCLRERMRASMEVSRIGFLKLIFTQEEKLSRFDSECRDIFDGCYVAGLPEQRVPLFLPSRASRLSLPVRTKFTIYRSDDQDASSRSRLARSLLPSFCDVIHEILVHFCYSMLWLRQHLRERAKCHDKRLSLYWQIFLL